MRVGGQHQQVAGTRIDTQGREVADIQFGAGQLLLVARQDLAAVAGPGKQLRRTLDTQHQLLIAFVPGDGLECLVLVLGGAQVVAWEVRESQLARVGIHLDQRHVVPALIHDAQHAVFHDRHAFRVAPAHQGNLAQHIALQAEFHQERVATHHCE